jgi:hypothetical protein
MRRKKRLSKAELRAMGVVPGLVVTRYAPDGDRATVEQLTAETSSTPSLFFYPTDQTNVLQTTVRPRVKEISKWHSGT